MFLEKINDPADLRSLLNHQLKVLADEVRQHMVSVLSQTPGHFAPNFGTIELAIALHKVFNTPSDKLVWDIGHQAYPHKILTGRRDQLKTVRQYDGISGFLMREESQYDVFGAGHSSTSIAAALGIASARDLRDEDFKVLAVIGDGGLTGGMAFEAMNAAGDFRKDMVIVLNDNQMSISKTVGAFCKYFNRIITNPTYNTLRSTVKEFLHLLPSDAKLAIQRIESALKPGMLFEEFGFRYFGPLDGHDLDQLIDVFENVKGFDTPILVHVLTTKGKGFSYAENDPERFYSVSTKFDPETGKSFIAQPSAPQYTDVFSRTLTSLAKKDTAIVGITAAMPGGTGLDKFREEFPERFFDIGLAEQCAVTYAAGLATEGIKPVVAIYSTFLQRAYDQVLHDVCIQNLPVVFSLDRAGLVGADGPTHHGVFDFAYLRSIPNMVVMAPKDENELQHMVKTAIDYEKGPIAFRYPRGPGVGVPLDEAFKSLPIGKAEVLVEGTDLLILAVGNRVHPAFEAAAVLSDLGISATVINARFIKPLDEELICAYADQVGRVITVEDHTLDGGFGSAVLEVLATHGILAKVTRLGIPNKFVQHGDVKTLYSLCGYDEEAIINEGVKICEK